MLPVMPLRLQLHGLQTLGLDLSVIHARLGPLPEAPDALIPVQAYLDMWELAQIAYGRPGLPTALAEVIPFGAFGMLDYLVGSADTIGASCRSALMHFALVASDVWLEHVALDDGAHLLCVRGQPDLPTEAVEFTLATIIQRLRHLCARPLPLEHVRLPVSRADPDPVRARFYGPGLLYDCPCAEVVIAKAIWHSAPVRADNYLHATLRQVAGQLPLSHPDDCALEMAVRARLRLLLPQGQGDPAHVAALLGCSERTLQRRLAENGLDFRTLLQRFRHEEAVRLLADPGQPLVEVAHRLGYTEQTSFTRAFRHWTNLTPGAWRAQQGVRTRRGMKPL